MSQSPEELNLQRQQANHPRHYREFTYVYPVISRRARGLSVGINLNIDTLCNFNCAYCQVDRSSPPASHPIVVDQLESELRLLLDHYATGEWKKEPIFPDLQLDDQQIRDLCISGDGEATMLPELPQVMDLLVALQKEYSALGFKLVLITNGTGLMRADLQPALARFVEPGGELWVKLDAGNEEYYNRIDDSRFPYRRLIDEICTVASRYPILLQSMFCTIDGEPPTREEIDERIERFREVWGAAPSNLREIQLYSIARPSANLLCEALPNTVLDEIAVRVRSRLPGVDVNRY